MADHKEYINQTLENGNVMISEDVIETIVAHNNHNFKHFLYSFRFFVIIF